MFLPTAYVPAVTATQGASDCQRHGMLPSFASEACSRCRFRVTGPNVPQRTRATPERLDVRIKQSVEKEQQINAEADVAENSDKSASHLRALARRERESRDGLFAEWGAELQTIKACQAVLEKSNADNGLHRALMPANSDFNPDFMDLNLKHVHQFELLQRIVVTAHLIPENQLDLPLGAEEARGQHPV